MGHRRPKVMLKFNAVPSIFCLADYDPATNKCFEECPSDGTSVRSSTAGTPSGVVKQGQCNNQQCAEEKNDLMAAKAKLENSWICGKDSPQKAQNRGCLFIPSLPLSLKFLKSEPSCLHMGYR